MQIRVVVFDLPNRNAYLKVNMEKKKKKKVKVLCLHFWNLKMIIKLIFFYIIKKLIFF